MNRLKILKLIYIAIGAAALLMSFSPRSTLGVEFWIGIFVAMLAAYSVRSLDARYSQFSKFKEKKNDTSCCDR